jgi:hypothetical protein
MTTRDRFVDWLARAVDLLDEVEKRRDAFARASSSSRARRGGARSVTETTNPAESHVISRSR